MDIRIKKLGKRDLGEFEELIRIFEDVFDMKDLHMPGKKHLQQLLDREEFLVFVAFAEDQMVGGLTAYMWQQYYSLQPLVYIYDLAVNRTFQRQGIGKKLVTAITGHCRQIGVEEVFVQADEPDHHALEFYRSTGAREEKVSHFSYPLNIPPQ